MQTCGKCAKCQNWEPLNTGIQLQWQIPNFWWYQDYDPLYNTRRFGKSTSLTERSSGYLRQCLYGSFGAALCVFVCGRFFTLQSFVVPGCPRNILSNCRLCCPQTFAACRSSERPSFRSGMSIAHVDLLLLQNAEVATLTVACVIVLIEGLCIALSPC